MRKNNTTKNVSRETINKGTNKMKTITLTLTEEQKEIIIDQLESKVGGIGLTDQKYINATYKNPSADTLSRVKNATDKWNRIMKKREILDKFIEQLKLNQ
tara:strand:+ start:553 stop:852 length:300 start_codon:yes stop_codon:yes gene_type:complete